MKSIRTFGLPPEKGGHFVTIAAGGHGAPAAAMGARVIVEKEATFGIGAPSNRGIGTLHKEFGCGPGDGR